MSALILYFVVGLFAGVFFRVQTLLVLTAAVLGEDLISFILSGIYAGLAWLLLSQGVLQIAYVVGVCLRCILEQAGIGVAAHRTRQS